VNLRVLTWNVWWRFGPDWRERQPRLLHYLREADADVVALQECWGGDGTSQAHEFAAALGRHAAFVAPGLPPAPPGSPHEVGLGLISRWPLRVSAEPLPSLDRDPVPVSAVAEIAHPAGTLHVIAACLEWEPAYAKDRIAQGRAVTDLATDYHRDGPLPVILCGDLNAAPDSPVLAPVHAAMVDTWTAGGGDPATTTLRSDHPQAPLEAVELLDQRIDHIFVRAGNPDRTIRVTGVQALGDPIDGLYPSDHYGVLCDLDW
jgi:endonuclease/exonuclease/phosphatase family metal-dependent hydrolase